MVRLVFRPYTHFWRSICASEPLRASTRVSSGFTLNRHSSPSFGSQQICSCSVRSPKKDSNRPMVQKSHLVYFHYAKGFATQILAYVLDSLVRVSRRVVENHFVKHPKRWCEGLTVLPTLISSQHAVLKSNSKGDQAPKKHCIPQSMSWHPSRL